jgi:mRNA interferase MazF
VQKPGSGDPRKQRVFVIVSRQTVIDSRYSTVICAPVFTRYDGLSTQIPVGINEGLKHESSIHCDQLVTQVKAVLTEFIGSLSPARINEFNRALAIAVGIRADSQ